jgi:hypothetical protein
LKVALNTIIPTLTLLYIKQALVINMHFPRWRIQYNFSSNFKSLQKVSLCVQCMQSYSTLWSMIRNRSTINMVYSLRHYNTMYVYLKVTLIGAWNKIHSSVYDIQILLPSCINFPNPFQIKHRFRYNGFDTMIRNRSTINMVYSLRHYNTMYVYLKVTLTM